MKTHFFVLIPTAELHIKFCLVHTQTALLVGILHLAAIRRWTALNTWRHGFLLRGKHGEATSECCLGTCEYTFDFQLLIMLFHASLSLFSLFFPTTLFISLYSPLLSSSFSFFLVFTSSTPSSFFPNLSIIITKYDEKPYFNLFFKFSISLLIVCRFLTWVCKCF